MASTSSAKVKLCIKKDGKDQTVECSKSVATLLTSSTVDPAVKQTLVDSLLSTPGTSTGQETGQEIPVLHFWKDKEEDLLVQARHERSDDFLKTRNHTNLWKEVVVELEAIGCKVTGQQAFNKYSSLKKKWKEIVDAPSGSEAKYFRHKEAFDTQFGTRASTRPVHTIDTDAEEKPSAQVGPQVVNPERPKLAKKSTKATRRKSTEVLELIREHHDDDKKVMQSMHVEKMRRLDRMLDLYEKEVESSCSQK